MALDPSGRVTYARYGTAPRQPAADINGLELLAVIEALRCALVPITLVTDSAYVMCGISDGAARACPPLGAWAYRWRELWAIIADHGGLGDAAVTF